MFQRTLFRVCIYKKKKKQQELYGKGFQKLVLSLKSLKPKNKILEFLKVQRRNCVVVTVSPYSSDLLKFTCIYIYYFFPRYCAIGMCLWFYSDYTLFKFLSVQGLLGGLMVGATTGGTEELVGMTPVASKMIMRTIIRTITIITTINLTFFHQ